MTDSLITEILAGVALMDEAHKRQILAYVEEINVIYDALDDGRKQQLADEAQRLLEDQRTA